MARGNGSGKSAFALESLEGRQLLTGVVSTPVIQPIDVVNPGGPIIVANQVKTQGKLIHPVVDTEFNGEVGTVSGVTGLASNLSNLHGSINWGDGHLSAATFVKDSNGVIEVDGSHEYKKTGEFHINITLTRTAIATPGQPTPQYMMLLGTIHSTAQVRENSTGGVTINELADNKFAAALGTFYYGGSQTLRASIDWGDNNFSVGTISKGKTGKYTVTGTHTYQSKGQYHIHITVTNAIVIDPLPASVVSDKTPAIFIVAQIESTADVA